MSIEIFDIDGTLTTSGDSPREDLIAYLKKDEEEGNRIIIVSGRPMSRLAETEGLKRTACRIQRSIYKTSRKSPRPM